MPKAESDLNLLFGVLALQMDFVTRDELIAGLHAWVLEKSEPLGRLLVRSGALSESRRALLSTLVEEHLREHDDDPERSLAALRVDALRGALGRVDDPEVRDALSRAGAGPPPSPDGDGDETTATLPEPDHTRPRFRVLRHHAKGGLGEVFIALDAEVNREVALKEIQARHADDPESRARFLLEAEVTGGLEHPGIVPVYGVGRYPDGRPYYAMRLIRGEGLNQAIEAYHRVEGPERDPSARSRDLRRLLRGLIDACNAVAYAHSRGILHRDLKPSNIMLGPYGETLVVDWGLAKPIGRPDGVPRGSEDTLRPGSGTGATPTQAGSVFGTPAYMSPEQASGEVDRLGPPSDVYSLGATLYCVLAGRPPLAGDRHEILRRARAGDFPPPRALDPAVPPSLEAICLKAMAREPASRHASARELAEAIEGWLAEEPMAAYRAAVAEYEALAAAHPDQHGCLEGLARSRAELGIALHVLGRLDEAERVQRAAIADYRALVDAQPLVTSYREGLASAHSNLGRGLMALGRADEAKDAYRAAFAEYERLVKIAPRALDYRTHLGNLLVSLGRSRDDVLRTLGRLPSADALSPGWPATRPPADEDSALRTTPPAALKPPSPPDQVTPSWGHAPPAPPADAPAEAADRAEAEAGRLDPESLQPGRTFLGRYRLERVLGQGAMGSVWLVRHLDLDRLAALKLVASQAGSDPRVRARFRREARAMARLAHPNAVTVHDVRLLEEFAYIDMEYVSGRSLDKVVQPGVPLPLALVARLLAQLCDVLQAAHDLGIVHRDLKPSNLMLVDDRPPGDEQLKVLDFGLAKLLDRADQDPAATLTGAFMGSAAYASPEQVAGDPVDLRSDLYSVALLLYEWLTGHRPFTGPAVRVLYDHLHTPPPPLADRNPAARVPPAVESVVLRGLAKDPAGRYQSARELAAAFAAALSESAAGGWPAPLSPPPPTAMESGEYPPTAPPSTLGRVAMASAYVPSGGWLGRLRSWLGRVFGGPRPVRPRIPSAGARAPMGPRGATPPPTPPLPAPRADEPVVAEASGTWHGSPPPPPAVADGAPPDTGEFGGRYRVLRPLAEGGLGRLWVVHDRELHRDVVLKELRSDQSGDPDARRWLIKEGQIAAQLEHARIIPVYDLGRSLGDRPFYTMMYVRGGTLRRRIAGVHRGLAGDRLEARRALIDAFLSACEGIAHAHARGVIHRDLKPENILVGDGGEVRVGDWGLAKVVGQEDDPGALAAIDPAEDLVTRPGVPLGTPAYMAPELALGRHEEVDARTDVYGLGAILFEILTGRPPHAGQAGLHVPDVLARIASEEVPRARSIDPTIPPALDALCARALAKSRADRFASVAELILGVRRAREGR